MKFVTICHGKENDVEDWRAYFAEECDFDETDDPMPHYNAKVGYGDSALEAISNLCLDEIAGIEEEQRQLRLYEKRMSPMTKEEWEAFVILYEEGTDIRFFEDDIIKGAWNLVHKNYANTYRGDMGRGFCINNEGIRYMEFYYEGTEE